MLNWTLIVLAALVALLALARARRLARRVDELTRMYWELKYDYGQLRERVTRLEPARDGERPDSDASVEQPAGFIPLSSLKQR